MIERAIGLSVAGVVAAWLCGCAAAGKARLAEQRGESVVFIGEEAAFLARVPARGQPISVRADYEAKSNGVSYMEGRDFIVDDSLGTLRRVAGSRLPDFRTNLLFGQEAFDHTKFPGFGNAGFFAYIDYQYYPSAEWPAQANQGGFLKSCASRLRSGEALRVVAFGDSITAGGDASKPELVFWRRWAEGLQRKYPGSRITAINGATGGDTTVQGLQRLKEKVLDQNPDLVLIGFGMNDHNVGSVPIPLFEQNLREMIARIRRETSAEVVLFSTFPPNPKWKFGSHHMSDYAEATRLVAGEVGCAYADVFNNWQSIAERKKPEDLLGNDINHPNDFGHWIYFKVLQAMSGLD